MFPDSKFPDSKFPDSKFPDSKFPHSKPRYSINDTLNLLGIGRATLYADINAGKLATYLVGPKRRFVSPEALDAYVALCEREAQG